MARQRYLDFGVGVFILAGVFSLFVMATQMSGWSGFSSAPEYEVSANFSGIGGLKVRAPVTVAGVRVGEVARIELQPESLDAKVTMRLQQDKKIPYDEVSARILTEGLLGSNYISIVPGFEEETDSDHPYLRAGDVIARTQEAMVLENLIGQLLFNIQK